MRTLAVVGLGTAGAAVAALAAQRGLRVIGLEARSFDRAGARWLNGVPGWMFDDAGIARPTGEELRENGERYFVIAGWDGPRIPSSPGLDVDMRLLVRRLQSMARHAGAELREGVSVTRLDGSTVHTTDGPIEVDVVVDAGGHNGPRLLGTARPGRDDLCTAVQEVYGIRDRAAAAAWFSERGGAVGDCLCFTGVAGGFSILNVRVHGDELGVLAGSMPATGATAARVLVDRLVASLPWAGERRFGGARAIPLGLPSHQIGRGRVAAIGDVAGQVHAAHGSGIGQQLLAARLLADTLADGGTPWEYNVAWQRRHGGLLAAADVFRRFSQTLGAADLGALIRHDVMAPATTELVMAQRPARLSPAVMLRAAVGMTKLPRLAGSMAPALARMRLVEAWYGRYPLTEGGLEAWLRRRDRIAGLPSAASVAVDPVAADRARS